MNIEQNISNYVAKFDVRGAWGVDTLVLAEKYNLVSLKLVIDI